MEMGPDARVWKTYFDEAEIADKDYITDNTATLDGILIFVRLRILSRKYCKQTNNRLLSFQPLSRCL